MPKTTLKTNLILKELDHFDLLSNETPGSDSRSQAVRKAQHISNPERFIELPIPIAHLKERAEAYLTFYDMDKPRLWSLAKVKCPDAVSSRSYARLSTHVLPEFVSIVVLIVAFFACLLNCS